MHFQAACCDDTTLQLTSRLAGPCAKCLLQWAWDPTKLVRPVVSMHTRLGGGGVLWVSGEPELIHVIIMTLNKAVAGRGLYAVPDRRL